MIYDCFTFFNELDLLEIRLNELSPVVDKFVLVEADRTFTNEKKSFSFEENRERYKQFHEKIIHIKISEYTQESCLNAWYMEFYQRNKIGDGLQNCQDDDIILISDIDEVPNTDEIINYKKGKYGSGLYCLRQTFFYYFLNYRNVFKYFYMAKILTFSEYLNGNWTPQKLRDANNNVRMIKNGGWHFSFLGGYETIIYKVKSFAHQEFNNDKYLNEGMIEKIKKGYDIFDRKNYRFVPVEIKKSKFPEYIFNNQEKYKHLIYSDVNCFRNIFLYFTIYIRYIPRRIKAKLFKILGVKK